MNKAELITGIATEAGMTKKDTGAALEAIISVITNALADGEEITLSGFGKFSVVEREARDCRNPLTGEMIHVDAKKNPKFKPSKVLKDALN